MPARTFDSILCFGDSDWWYHNRGHADMQFMRRFARHWPVLYVNSLGVRTPKVSEGRMFLRRVLRKVRSVARYYRDGGDGFSVLSPIYLPLVDGPAGRWITSALAAQICAALRASGMHRPLVWVTCPSAASVLPALPKAGVVHQLSDCYAALHDGDARLAVELEQALVRQADLIVCSSTRLQDRARELYGRGEYVDHGVDFEMFAAAARAASIPPEIPLNRHPLIGFFGNLDDNTVDRALLEDVVRLRPQYTFVLVGPMARDFESLRRLDNLIAIPQRPYAQIAWYGAAFDVCLMPWLHNEWIEHCNPIKLKEYLTLGKPIVSTPFPELRHCGHLCYQAPGAEAFAAAIDQALREDNPARRAERQAWARRYTWDAQFGRVLELLESTGLACTSCSCPRWSPALRRLSGQSSRIYACGMWPYAPRDDPLARCRRCHSGNGRKTGDARIPAARLDPGVRLRRGPCAAPAGPN
jgi:glycosyltransferase involved in cell wall biosynthesis